MILQFNNIKNGIKHVTSVLVHQFVSKLANIYEYFVFLELKTFVRKGYILRNGEVKHASNVDLHA